MVSREEFGSFVMLHVDNVLWFELMRGVVGRPQAQLEINDKQSAWAKLNRGFGPFCPPSTAGRRPLNFDAFFSPSISTLSFFFQFRRFLYFSDYNKLLRFQDKFWITLRDLHGAANAKGHILDRGWNAVHCVVCKLLET
jgi:hypothetical protein